MKIRNIDVGIIVVIPVELKQLLEVFNVSENNRVDSIDNNFIYYQFSLNTETRPISVVISCINGKAGNIESSLCTSYFFKNWNPRLMCLLGIAAGIENKIEIGDVVIPYKIHDITIKSYIKNEFKNRTNTYTRHDEINKMIKTKLNDYNFEFSIKDGSLGADNVLIRDDSYFYEFLCPIDEECRGGEMESAGFVRACEIEGNTPWLILRGISDFGKEKTDKSQADAAKNACITLKYFLENCLDINKISPNKENIANNYMEDYFEHKLNINYSKKNWANVCEINNIISRYLLLTGQYRLRIALGQKALEAAKNGGLLEYSCQVLIDDLGWTYFLLFLETLKEQYKETALNYIKKGLDDADKINDDYMLSKGYRHLASISRQAKEIPKASKYLRKAKEYMRCVNDVNKRNELESVLLLSESKLCYAKTKNCSSNSQKKKLLEKCVDFAYRAEEKYIELEDNERTVKVYKFLYMVFQNSGQDELARNFLTKLDNLMKQYGRVLYWD